MQEKLKRFIILIFILLVGTSQELYAQRLLDVLFGKGKFNRFLCGEMGAYTKRKNRRLKKEARFRTTKRLPAGTPTQAKAHPRSPQPPGSPVAEAPPKSSPPPVSLNEKPKSAGPPDQHEEPISNRPPSPAPVELKPPVLTKKDFRKMTEQEQRKKLLEMEPTIVLPPIQFVTAQDEFSVVNMDSFMQAMEYAQQGKIVLVEGHTDDIGSETYNLNLSMKRAEKIRSLMLSGGVSDGLISVIGFGESKPLVPNTSAANRAVNRRIEFKIFSIPE